MFIGIDVLGTIWFFQ